MTRKRSGLYWIRVACVVAVTMPNCTRCCPTGFGSCQCNWAWEDCPASGNGCNSCSSSSGGAMSVDNPFEAGSRGQSFEASVEDEDGGGTLAFVTSGGATYLVASMGTRGEVRAFRVDANALDEDPLTVRPTALFPFDGDGPGRAVSDERGHAIVALRTSGAIVTIDPRLATAGERHAVCSSPNALATRNDETLVGCGSGELVTLRTSDFVELGRVRLDGELDEVAVSGDGVVAGAGTTLYALDADAGVTRRDAAGIVGPLRAAGAAFDGDIGSLGSDGFHAKTHAQASVTDLAPLGDAAAFVAGGEAWLRASADSDPIPIAESLAARAVALADVPGEITRRVVVVRSVEPSMLVFFTVPGIPSAAAIEPLE